MVYVGTVESGSVYDELCDAPVLVQQSLFYQLPNDGTVFKIKITYTPGAPPIRGHGHRHDGILSGLHRTRILADLGARVIKASRR